MGGRYQLGVALIWLVAFARGLWRAILAQQGILEFRAEWVWRWDWWPTYVDFWQLAGTVIAFCLFVVNWRQIDWKEG